MEETLGPAARLYASPCTGFALRPKAMAYGDFGPYERMLQSSYPFASRYVWWVHVHYGLDGSDRVACTVAGSPS